MSRNIYVPYAGGVNGSETDDAAQTSQRNGVAALYMIFAGKFTYQIHL